VSPGEEGILGAVEASVPRDCSAAELELVRKHFAPLGRLLVVDDQAPIRRMLQRFLDVAGYEIEEAENGEEALDRIASGSFDLVLLDVMMPRLDGPSTLRRLREQAAYARLPVIMVTAVGEVADIVRIVGFGAQDYIVKPLGMTTLIRKVDQALSVNRSALLATAERTESRSVQ
jgi:DNA-binding response OmpR family regulator